MPTFGDRIRTLLAEKGISQAELARQVGTKQQTISYIVRGDGPAQTSRYAAKIAAVLNVNPLWLQTGEGRQTDPIVPTAHSASSSLAEAALVAIFPSSEIGKYLLGGDVQPSGGLMSEVKSPQEAFAFEITDNSMYPMFKTGDVVVIERGLPPEPSDYVIATTESGDAVFRRYRSKRGGFELVPENTDWDALSSDEGVTIHGVMIEHRRYRKR